MFFFSHTPLKTKTRSQNPADMLAESSVTKNDVTHRWLGTVGKVTLFCHGTGIPPEVSSPFLNVLFYAKPLHPGRPLPCPLPRVNC